MKIMYKPEQLKEYAMKNLIRIVTLCSLLVFSCLMISACGGGAENFVQGNGQVDVFVTNASTAAIVTGARIDVTNAGKTNVIQTQQSDTTGKNTFQLTVGSDYTFTITAAGFATRTFTVTPLLTATVTINAQ